MSNAKKNTYPMKKEERSREETIESTREDETAAPDIAKSLTNSEAKQIFTVSLKPIEVRYLETTIGGDELICHAWGPKARKKMLDSMQMSEAEKKLAKKSREAKDPDAEFEEARYFWDKADWFPTNGIKKAMVSAGVSVGVPRSLVQRSLFVGGTERRDYAKIDYARLEKREDAVQVGPFGKKTADLRYRPAYHNWTMTLRIKYRADLIDETQVLMLLRDAGFSIGIGEWRAEKDGQFGSFDLVDQSAKAKKRAA